jgi:hypothetical protein
MIPNYVQLAETSLKTISIHNLRCFHAKVEEGRTLMNSLKSPV